MAAPEAGRGDAGRALLETALRATLERLALDRSFAAAIGRRRASGGDPLDPELWEAFVETRRELDGFSAQTVRATARDRESMARNADVRERLDAALAEAAALEKELAGFLSESLASLREAIDGLARGQAVFSSYARSGHARPAAESLEARA
jgi:hypothetical protein